MDKHKQHLSMQQEKRGCNQSMRTADAGAISIYLGINPSMWPPPAACRGGWQITLVRLAGCYWPAWKWSASLLERMSPVQQGLIKIFGTPHDSSKGGAEVLVRHLHPPGSSDLQHLMNSTRNYVLKISVDFLNRFLTWFWNLAMILMKHLCSLIASHRSASLMGNLAPITTAKLENLSKSRWWTLFWHKE